MKLSPSLLHRSAAPLPRIGNAKAARTIIDTTEETMGKTTSSLSARRTPQLDFTSAQLREMRSMPVLLLSAVSCPPGRPPTAPAARPLRQRYSSTCLERRGGVLGRLVRPPGTGRNEDEARAGELLAVAADVVVHLLRRPQRPA